MFAPQRAATLCPKHVCPKRFAPPLYALPQPRFRPSASGATNRPSMALSRAGRREVARVGRWGLDTLFRVSRFQGRGSSSARGSFGSASWSSTFFFFFGAAVLVLLAGPVCGPAPFFGR